MFGAIPGKPALGRGPAVDGDHSRHPYHHPAAGWGAAESVASVLARAGEPIEGFRAIFLMNHEDGGCAVSRRDFRRHLNTHKSSKRKSNQSWLKTSHN